MRIKNNMISNDSSVAPLYTLRKDHKDCSDEYRGPPVRPVCGAVVGLQLQAFTRDERDTG